MGLWGAGWRGVHSEEDHGMVAWRRERGDQLGREVKAAEGTPEMSHS